MLRVSPASGLRRLLRSLAGGASAHASFPSCACRADARAVAVWREHCAGVSREMGRRWEEPERRRSRAVSVPARGAVLKAAAATIATRTCECCSS